MDPNRNRNSVIKYYYYYYSPSLYNINVYIVIYGSYIYKVLSIAYSRLLRGIYVDYNTIEFLRGCYSAIIK